MNPTEALSVQPDNTVDAPSTVDFESYEATRRAEIAASEAPPPAEKVEVEPEPAASEPAIENTPAEPETDPEPAAASGTVDEPQDKKQETGKKDKGIPQERLNEVTKHRREAEAARDAATARVKALEDEVAALKAKPAETPKVDPPPAAAETKPAVVPETRPKPVAPEPPTLESCDGDWDKYQAAEIKYRKEDYPQFTEDLSDWKAEQRDNAKQQKETEAKAAADARAAEDARTAASKQFEQSWNAKIAATRAKHPDFDEATKRDTGGQVLNSPAMQFALNGFDDPGEIIYYLANHHDEAIELAKATKHEDGLAPAEYQRRVAIATKKFLAIEAGFGTPATPELGKNPANHKPNVSRAPKPPTPVNPSSPAPTDPREAAMSGDFQAYEKRRQPQLTRR